MFKKPLILNSAPERERLFHNELVRYGVHYQKAAQVAKILAAQEWDEQMTTAEQRLVDEVCHLWLQQRKRLNLINTILQENSSGSKR
jgi:hypothetical protein